MHFLIRAATAAALALVIGACGTTAPRTAPDAWAAPAGPVAITGVTVIELTDGSRQEGTTIVAEGGRIVRVGRDLAVPRGAMRVDGRGKYLIPGLWDMHSHHQASGVESLPLFLANGVVGTRDMGSDADFILPLRERIRRGALAGPEIVAAGPILDAAPADWPYRRRVADAEEARAAVTELAGRGVDFIKVHDATPRDSFFAIVAEAAERGLPVAGHVPAGITIDEAVAARMASIEHLANNRIFAECSGGAAYLPERCRALFGRLAAAGARQTPTLAFFQTIPDLFSGTPPAHVEFASPSLREMWRKNQEASRLSAEIIAYLRTMNVGALAAVRDLHRSGVPLLAGCDGLVPGFCLHDELEWMVRAGLTPIEALRNATLEPARFLRREATHGKVETGMAADLLLLDADPTADIRNTRRIAAVIVRGRVIGRAELDRMLAEAKAEFARDARQPSSAWRQSRLETRGTRP